MKRVNVSEILKGKNPTYTYNGAEDLEIIGDIPDGATIEIKSQGHSGFSGFSGNVGGTSFHNCFSAGGGIKVHNVRIDGKSFGTLDTMSQKCANLTITGNVGKKAEVSSESDITITGQIRVKSRIYSSGGDITAMNSDIKNGTIIEAGSNCKIKTKTMDEGATIKTGMHCNITVGDVYDGATIKTDMHCSITAVDVYKGAKIETGMHCHITAKIIHKGASITKGCTIDAQRDMREENSKSSDSSSQGASGGPSTQTTYIPGGINIGGPASNLYNASGDLVLGDIYIGNR